MRRLRGMLRSFQGLSSVCAKPRVWRAPIWQTQTDNARQFIQQSQSFPEIFHVLASGLCPTRTLRRLIGDHRANAPVIRANAPMAGKNKRPPRSWPQRSAMASPTCRDAIIAGAWPCAVSMSVGNTVEERLPRSRGPTSKAPVARPVRRKRPSQTERIADTPDTVELAKQTLQTICRDLAAPAAARAQAARTLLELAGALKNTAADTARKTAPELSLAELDARLASLSAHDAA